MRFTRKAELFHGNLFPLMLREAGYPACC